MNTGFVTAALLLGYLLIIVLGGIAFAMVQKIRELLREQQVTTNNLLFVRDVLNRNMRAIQNQLDHLQDQIDAHSIEPSERVH